MTQLPVSFSLLNLGFRIDIVGLNLCLPEFRNQYLKREKHFNIDMLVEIKCQLDATDEFLLQILLLAQHVSGTIMPIIRSSSVSGLRAAAAVRKPDTQPSAPHHTDNLKTKHQIRQAATTCIILSSS